MKRLTLPIMLLISTLLFGQKTSTISIKEIQSAFEEKGIDSTLVLIRRMPIYRLDTNVSLSISYSCNSIVEYSPQLEYLTEIGLHIKNEKLNQVLLTHIGKYRIAYKETKRIPLIDKGLVFGIIHQDIPLSTVKLKDEFDFWKNIGDSISTYITDTTKEFSKIKQSYNRCKYNYFVLAYALSKFDKINYTVEYVDSLGIPDPDLIYDKVYFVNLKNDSAKWDTITLTNNYRKLNEINILNEVPMIYLYKQFGTLDKNCWVKLIYNTNAGILYMGSRSSENQSWDVMYELKLISSNKLLVRWIVGGVS